MLRTQTKQKGREKRKSLSQSVPQLFSLGIISASQGLTASCVSSHAFSTFIQNDISSPVLRKWEPWCALLGDPCSWCWVSVMCHPSLCLFLNLDLLRLALHVCTTLSWMSALVDSILPSGCVAAGLEICNYAVECQDSRKTVFIYVTKHGAYLTYFVIEEPPSKWERLFVVRKAAFPQESQRCYQNIISWLTLWGQDYVLFMYVMSTSSRQYLETQQVISTCMFCDWNEFYLHTKHLLRIHLDFRYKG